MIDFIYFTRKFNRFLNYFNPFILDKELIVWVSTPAQLITLIELPNKSAQVNGQINTNKLLKGHNGTFTPRPFEFEECPNLLGPKFHLDNFKSYFVTRTPSCPRLFNDGDLIYDSLIIKLVH